MSGSRFIWHAGEVEWLPRAEPNPPEGWVGKVYSGRDVDLRPAWAWEEVAEGVFVIRDGGGAVTECYDRAGRARLAGVDRSGGSASRLRRSRA